MPDSFSNPQDQAQMNALVARLNEIDATTKTAAEMIASEAAALREQRGRTVAQRAEGSAGRRSTASAVPSLQQEVEAINAQVLSYEKLNSLIAERIGLERQAAAAAANTARATVASGTEASASRVAAAPVPVQAQETTLAAQMSAQEAWYAQQRQRQQYAATGNRSLGGELPSQGEYAAGLTSAAGAQAAGRQQAAAQASAEAQAAAAAAERERAAALSELGAVEARVAAEDRAFIQSTEAEIAATAELRANLAETTAQWLIYDDTVSKSGGLSAAALQALGNGTITLRELGAQASTVVSKFAGWTAAAAGVYAVFGALTEVKDGAVAASSAVQGLTKFIPNLDRGSANNEIIKQSQETATPITDVGQTAQQFAKVLGNQNDVFSATHVALVAAKLDNIALADSYKYLTAIMQESGAKADQLPGIFDQITAAQDRVGARMSQILPAYAGSVGAVKTAGGDPNELLGLEALTITRAGLSGSQVGTMYARGATNFFPTAASRGVLERHDINPNQGMTQALIEAITKAQTEDLPEAVRRQLSVAFFGSLRGSRGATLFSTPLKGGKGSLEYALQQTSPGAASGLTQTQLDKTMGQANNQLALLKVNLQAIGAALSSSDFTSPFGVLVHLLNDALQLTTRLIQAWNSLPAPVKQFGSDAAAGIGAIALSRRFNLGGTTPLGRIPVLGGVLTQRPEVAAQKQGEAVTAAIRKDYQAQLASAVTQQKVAGQSAIVAKGTGDQEAYDVAVKRQAEAAARAAVIEAELVALEEQGVEYLKLRNSQFAAQASGGGAGAGALILPAGVRGGTAAASEAAVSEAGASESMAAVFGVGAMSMNMEAVNAATSSLASTLMSYAIPALLAYTVVQGMITEGTQQMAAGITHMSQATTTGQLNTAYNQGENPQWRVPILGFHIPNIPLSLDEGISKFAGGDPNDIVYKAQAGLLDARQRAAEASNSVLGRVSGDVRGGNYAQAYKTFKGDDALKLLNPGLYQNTLSTLYDKEHGLSPAAAGGGGATNPFAQWITASKDLKNQLQPMLESYANSIKVFGANNSDISSLAHGYAYAVQQFGNNPQDTQAMQALAQASQSLKSALDQQVQDLISLAQESTSGSQVTGDYQKALAAVNLTQAKTRESFKQAIGLNPKDRPQLQRAEQKQLGQEATDRQSAVQGLLAYYQSQTQLAASQNTGVGPEADLIRAEAQLKGLRGQLAAAHSNGADATTLNQLEAQVNQQLVTVLQDRLTYFQQMSQAVTQYQQGGTADPIEQQQIAISQLQTLYRNLIAAGDHDKAQLLGILGQERSAGLQEVAAQISTEQAQQQTSLAQMNIGQPQQVQLVNAVTVAQRELSYLQSLPKNKVNPTTLIQAQGALYQAQGALAQYQIQQGQQMIQAESALAQGQTFDPVAIAAAALAGAKRLLAYDTAHNMSPATLKQDAAGVAQAWKSQQEAQWQKSESTTEFLASTYQITGAQEISRLKSLMATMKKAHASYSEIQQVAQQLWNLEYGNSGNLNLNTGALHLPSTYEVKSAILGAHAAQRRVTHAGLLADVRNDVKLNVYVSRDADMQKVSKAIKDAIGQGVDSLAQAAGLV